MPRIPLLLLSATTLFRATLTGFLEIDPAFRVLAECSSSAEALAALKRKRIDLVLLDHDLGNPDDALAFVRKAREAGFGGRIFLIASNITAEDVISALANSVCGIFLKHNSPQLLIEALHKAMAGQTWIDHRCVRLLKETFTHHDPQARKYSLTQREMGVLKGVLAGFTNRQIGDQLEISEGSVKSALQQLFLKTGVRTRTQLARIALEELRSSHTKVDQVTG